MVEEGIAIFYGIFIILYKNSWGWRILKRSYWTAREWEEVNGNMILTLHCPESQIDEIFQQIFDLKI